MELLKTLNIDAFAIVINIFGFLILLWIANGLVFKPIGRVIDTRQEEIASTYDKIDSDQKAMEATRDDYMRRLAAIEEERRETVQRAINEAQATRDQIISEAQARAQEMTRRAETEIAHERDAAMISLRNQVVDLALGATTKLIGDTLDETGQRRLINEFINAGTAPNVPQAAASSAAQAA